MVLLPLTDKVFLGHFNISLFVNISLYKKQDTCHKLFAYLSANLIACIAYFIH
jgi:hypothetical protein